MGRATEAMFYGKHGFKPEYEEMYSRLDLSSKAVRKGMAAARRLVSKTESSKQSLFCPA